MRTRTRGSPSWPERMLRGRIHYCRLIETNSPKSTCRSGAGHTFGTYRCLSNKTALAAMIFKLAEAAEKSWRRLDCHNQFPKIIHGVTFADGIEVVRPQAQPVAA